MQLSELKVKGYKSLKDTSVSGISRVTALIGKTNSGKTALLQALAYLSTRSETSFFNQLLRGADVEDWFKDVTTDHSEQPIRVTISLIFSAQDKAALEKLVPGLKFGKGGFGETIEATYRLGVTLDADIRLDSVNWALHSQKFPYVIPRGDEVSALNLERIATSRKPLIANEERLVPGETYLDWRSDISFAESDDPQYGPLRMIDEWLGRFIWLPPERMFATAVAINAPVGQDQQALPRDYQFLLNNDRRMAETVEGLMEELIPGIGRILAPINPDNNTTAIRISTEDLEYSLIHAGHGVSCMLKLVILVATAKPGSTLLIEEPETALQAGAQRAVAELLERIAKERDLQILLTTHSSVLARETDQASTKLITLTNEGTVARNLSRDDFPHLKHELGARNSDLFMSNLVFFCEDAGALHFYPIVFSLLDLDLAAAGIRIVALHGSSKERIIRLREHLEYLGDSGVLRFVVLDDDEGATAGTSELIEESLLTENSVTIWSEDGNPAEFEDQFGHDLLVKAANLISQRAGATAKLDVKELQKRAAEKGGTMVSKVLQRYYHEVHGYGLSKVDLASTLADLLVEDPGLIPQSIRDMASRLEVELQRKPAAAAVADTK